MRGADGQWHGLKAWSRYHAAQIELQDWEEMGASVGLLASDEAFALDVDAHVPEIAAQIEQLAALMLGPAPKRVGRWPKFALLYRSTEPIRQRFLRFDSTPERMAEKRPDRVEIPSQVVLDGTHPATGLPYAWPIPPVPIAELTAVSPAQLDEFFSLLRSILPCTAGGLSEIDRAQSDQDRLRGDADLIERAVRSTPNNSTHFRYEEWVRLAAAIRGALPDDQDRGLEIFREFSDRTDISERLEDEERVYWSVQPPFGVGAEFIIQQANRLGNFASELWWEPPGAPEEAPASPDTGPTKQPLAGSYELLRVESLITKTKTPFLIEGYVPEKSLGFLYGDPGTGKSFVALDWALHLAFACESWYDSKINNPGAVIYIAGEGVQGAGARIKAWLNHNNRRSEDLDQRRFGLVHETVNFRNMDDYVKLARTIDGAMVQQGLPVSLIVVDTVSRVLPGADENLQKEMTLFVQACDALRLKFGCAVLGVHHASKGGSLRGSTVLSGAGDFVFKLLRRKGESNFTLWCEKMKEGEDDGQNQFSLKRIELGQGLDGKPMTSLVVDRVARINVQQRSEAHFEAPETTASGASMIDDGF